MLERALVVTVVINFTYIINILSMKGEWISYSSAEKLLSFLKSHCVIILKIFSIINAHACTEYNATCNTKIMKLKDEVGMGGPNVGIIMSTILIVPTLAFLN